jgi:hypothetical protein
MSVSNAELARIFPGEGWTSSEEETYDVAPSDPILEIHDLYASTFSLNL